MFPQLWMRKVVSFCVLLALVTTTSMVALAGPGRVAAELTVSGKVIEGESPVVMVNGEASKTGRSVFSSSTITTPNETSAILGIGRTGRLEIGPASSVNLVFDDTSVDAELTSGTLTVLGSSGTVKVRTTDGKTTILNSGESITASGQPQNKKQSGGSDNLWIWLLVAGGVAAAVLIAVSQSNNDNNVVSPNR